MFETLKKRLVKLIGPRTEHIHLHGSIEKGSNHWDYRVVEYEKIVETGNGKKVYKGYSLCEVYYADGGVPHGRSELNYVPLCKSIEGQSKFDALLEMRLTVKEWLRAIDKVIDGDESVVKDWIPNTEPN